MVKILRRHGLSSRIQITGKTPEESGGKPEPRELPEWVHRAMEDSTAFFDRERGFLEQYAGTNEFFFSPSGGWYFDHRSRRTGFDPSWFVKEAGYTPNEALFAAMHEINHLRFMLEDPRTYLAMAERWSRSNRIHTLYNCVMDVHDNRGIVETARGLEAVPERLYKRKLFQESDFRQRPRHVQFAEAILREAMVPNEQCQVDPEVRRALDELKHYRGADVVDLLTNPTIRPDLFYHTMTTVVEPVYDRLYKKDLEERKEQAGGSGGKGKGGKSPEEMGEEEFDEDYDDAGKKVIAKPLKPEDLKDLAGKAIRGEIGGGGEKEDEGKDKGTKEGGEDQEGGGRGAGPKDLFKKAYERQHGVSWTDVERYRRAYARISSHLDRMRRVFDRIINERVEWKSRLSTLSDEGALVEPGLVGVAAKARVLGHKKPRVFRTFEEEPKQVLLPTEFEFTWVADRTGSMEGPKKIMQRDCGVLMTEGLREFAEKTLEKKGRMQPNLSVKSEGRAFADTAKDEELKPLSPLIAEDPNQWERKRVEIFKTLSSCPGAATHDYTTLEAVIQNLTPEQKEKLKAKTLKKAVVFMTDGCSSDPDKMKRMITEAKRWGMVIKAVGIISDANERAAFKALWGEDGLICDKPGDLPEVMTELTNELVGDVNKPA